MTTPTNGPLEPADALDMTAIAADDALLDSLGTPQDALTWDGTVADPKKPTDALIWTDEPVRRPTGTPVKKTGAGWDDPAARLLSLVLADAATDLDAAVGKMCDADDAAAAVPGVTWGQAAPGVAWGKAAPGVTWGRLARRTGTRGAAALAAVVVSLGGVAAASVVAGPSSPLYPVHKLFAGPNPASEQAYALSRATAALDDAQHALDAHQPGLAHGKLTVADQRLRSVADGAAKDALVTRYDALAALVAAATSAATDRPTKSPTAVPTPTPTPTRSTSPADEPTSSGPTSPPTSSEPTRTAESPDPSAGTGSTSHADGEGKGNGKGDGNGKGNGKDKGNGKSNGKSNGKGKGKDGKSVDGKVNGAKDGKGKPSKPAKPAKPAQHGKSGSGKSGSGKSGSGKSGSGKSGSGNSSWDQTGTGTGDKGGSGHSGD